MTTTDTPRTDAARTLGGVIVNDSLALLGEPRSFDSINVVPADFARDLERELYDAEIRIQAEVADLKQALEIANRSADDQMFQKREAEAEVERLKSEGVFVPHGYVHLPSIESASRVSQPQFDSLLLRAEKAEAEVERLRSELKSSVNLLAKFNTLRLCKTASLTQKQWDEYCRLYRNYN